MLALRTAVRKVERLAYSPDGTRLAAGGPTGTEVLEVASGGTVALLGWAGMAHVAFRPGGDSILVAHSWHPTAVVELASPDAPQVASFSHGHGSWLHTVHLLPATDEWLNATQNRVVRSRCARTPRSNLRTSSQSWIFTPAEGNVHPRLLTTYGDPLKVVFLASVSAAANEHNKYLYLLDGDTGELIRRHRCGYGSVEHFTGSPCGGYLVGVLQATLVVWDTAALHLPPQRWANDSRKQFTGVAFHPHGRHLLTASNDKSVKLWDLTCGQVVRSYDWSAGRMRSVAVAPDGLTAAAGSDENLVVLFDLDL